MDLNHSNYTENQEYIILNEEGKYIIIKNEMKEENEEEKSWDYEDGGQTMEELDRLEKLELKLNTLLNVYSRFKNRHDLIITFNKWKNIEYFTQIEDISNDTKEIYSEQILHNIPIKKEIDYPFIIRDWKFEDKLSLLNLKPKKKFEKINIINELILSDENIDINTPEYFYNINNNKNFIPKLINIKEELSPIKIKRKEKIIELEENINEIKFNKIRPNNIIKRSIDNIINKNIKKEEINNNINYISNKFKEKINERENSVILSTKLDKYFINEKIKEIKDIEINKDYCSEIFDSKIRKKDEKLKILDFDYIINISEKNKFEKQNNNINIIENENLINDSIQDVLEKENQIILNNNKLKKEIIINDNISPTLSQKPEKKYKIIDIPKENNDEIIIEKIVPNNPINKIINQPFVYIDIINDNYDEIQKKPKIKMDKINTIDKIDISNNLDLINTDYNYNLNIKKNINIPNIISRLNNNLSLISNISKNSRLRNKNKAINIDENIINKKLLTSDKKEIFCYQIIPNNIKRRNIIPSFIQKDELNNIENIKNLNNKINKINITDEIKINDININIKNNNNYEYKKPNNKNNLIIIPEITTKNKETSLNPIEIDIFKFKDKYCLTNKILKEKYEPMKIQKDYKNIKNKYKNRNDNLPLLFNNYQLSEINTNKLRENNINTIIDNETILDDMNINLENEMINFKNKNNIIPEKLNKYSLNQIPELIKTFKKINLTEKIEISLDNIKLKKTNFILCEHKNIINIPKIDTYSSNLNPIEINLPFKKYLNQENPKEIFNPNLKTDYILNKKYTYFNEEIKRIPIINNDYQIFIPKYFNKSKINKNIIKNENIIKNDIISLKEENSINNKIPKEIFELPQLHFPSLIQKPENIKISKLIEISDSVEEINIEKIKINKPYNRIKIENKNIIKDKIFEDSDEIKKKYKKTINKIDIIDNLLISNNIELPNLQYELKNKNKDIMNIPKINLYTPVLFPVEIKSSYKKNLYQEKPKEILKTDIKINYINEKYIRHNIQLKSLQIINNEYQIYLPKYINKSKINKNIIENENIINNDIISLKEENSIKYLNTKELFNLPKIKSLSLIQKPENIKSSKLIEIPNIVEEINIEKIKLNKPYNRIKIENKNIMKDKVFEDSEEIKNKYKKTINKIDIIDNILISDKIELRSTQYKIKNKNNNLIPKIIIKENYQLNPIQLSLKIKLEKNNTLKKPSEIKNIIINKDYLNIINNINKRIKDKLPLSLGNYQLSEINTNIINYNHKNIIENENILDNKYIKNNEFISKFLKEEDKFKECSKLFKFSLSNNNVYNLIQKPEIIKISKIIKVPNISDEINIEQIKSNKAIKREYKNQDIIKDKIFEDLDNIKKANKKQIKKININENIQIYDNMIDIKNPGYVFKNNKNKKIIPNIILSKQEINPIKFSIELKLEKFNQLEKNKEIKEIKLKKDYYIPNIEHKYIKKDDNLQFIQNNYQLSKLNLLEENINNSNKNIALRGKKSILQKQINNIENENIQKNNNFKEEIIPIEYNKEKPQFNFNPLTIKTLNQKPEKISEKVNNTDLKLNKNLLEEFGNEEIDKTGNKITNLSSTEFKFYDSNNRELAKFNLSSFSQNQSNSDIQKQFFSFMHKKFVDFMNNHGQKK